MGAGTAADPFQIGSREDMVTLSARVAGGQTYAGTFFKVTQDINMNLPAPNEAMLPAGTRHESGTNNFQQIGYRNRPFRGVFDGNNMTISNLRINRTATSGDLNETLAMIGCLGQGGTVKNVILEDVSISGAFRYNAGIVGIMDGGGNVVENCRVNSGTIEGVLGSGGIVGWMNSNAIVRNCETGTGLTINGISSAHSNIGGIVGHTTATTNVVEGCINRAAVLGGQNYIGGIVGYNNGTVRNSVNHATITQRNTGQLVGGIVGASVGAATRVENCTNHGRIAISGTIAVNARVGAGGIAGYSDGTVIGSQNMATGIVVGTATVLNGTHANNNQVGGIVGDNRGTIENCFNHAPVRGHSQVGGIVGHSYGANARVRLSGNLGVVNAGGNNVGGVVGEQNGTTAEIRSCYNRANVTTTGVEAGGIVGRNVAGTVHSGFFGLPNNVITNTLQPTVMAGNQVGGIAGYSNGTVVGCVAWGNVISNGVIGSTHGAGGLLGYHTGGSLTYSYHAKGHVVGIEQVGGAIGRHNNGTVNYVGAFTPRVQRTLAAGNINRFAGSLTQTLTRTNMRVNNVANMLVNAEGTTIAASGTGYAGNTSHAMPQARAWWQSTAGLALANDFQWDTDPNYPIMTVVPMKTAP